MSAIQRQGLGELRHIDSIYLFVQNPNAEKIIRFAKIPGAEKPADMCTKGLGKDAIQRYTELAYNVFRDGRPLMCPQLVVFGRICRTSSGSAENPCLVRGRVQGCCAYEFDDNS